MTRTGQDKSLTVCDPVFRLWFSLSPCHFPFHPCLVALQKRDVIPEDQAFGGFQFAFRGSLQGVLCLSRTVKTEIAECPNNIPGRVVRIESARYACLIDRLLILAE